MNDTRVDCDIGDRDHPHMLPYSAPQHGASGVCSVWMIGEPYCQAGTRSPSTPTATVIEDSHILVSKRRIREELEIFSSKHPLFTLGSLLVAVPPNATHANETENLYHKRYSSLMMREQAGQTGTTRLEGGGFTLAHSETSQPGRSIARHTSSTNQSGGWKTIVMLSLPWYLSTGTRVRSSCYR